MKKKLCITILIGILALTGCGRSTESGAPISSGDTQPPANTEGDGSQVRSTQTEENDNTAYPRCVMVDGVVYKDTGYAASMPGCGNMDGEITSAVEETELPTENNQSNFGTGYQYQGASENCIRIEMDGEKRIFRDIKIDDDAIPMEVMNFDARVKEICENGELLVTHISTPEGFNKMSEGDYYAAADNLRGEVQVGDIVTIWFNGMILETDPAQLGEVYRIEKANAE